METFIFGLIWCYGRRGVVIDFTFAIRWEDNKPAVWEDGELALLENAVSTEFALLWEDRKTAFWEDDELALMEEAA